MDENRAEVVLDTVDSVSLYGTADAGVLGTETPLSVSVRRFRSDRPSGSIPRPN